MMNNHPEAEAVTNECEWEFLREADLPMGAVINGTTIQEWRVDAEGERWVKCKTLPQHEIRGVPRHYPTAASAPRGEE
ncbi:hypothetical protein Pla175_05500 [Pirellulimonas nuda]|uniref:Uncharacterized protein n=1 Tax=Pirellulimonas nuda TaxID=2528009 RepID=A0A518D6T9_9BACT|nr:hypothetical protein [Pirellulimonas nuda]QDU87193.1 hypothetical protein Pla175_05500 [Pirellulimonas nuda]